MSSPSLCNGTHTLCTSSLCAFVAGPGVSDAGECFHYILSESGKDDEIAAAAAAAAVECY
jgi:hypothetical protein